MPNDTIPSFMTAIEITEAGGPEVLKPTQRPVPVPKDGEVLIKVGAAGVNRPDVIQRQGLYPPPPGASDIPGLEIAGEIVAATGDCGEWKVGMKACALVTGGGYAEYCPAPAPQLMPVPGGYSMARAAALPETFFTVWTNVFERCALQPGETFMVHGGTSGIGTTAIQMAARLGARVIATAGSDAKCDACLELGAEQAVNYREGDFVEAAKAFGGGKGVDVILDMVGGDYVAKNIKSLAADGRMASIAFLKGSKVEVNLMPVMLKRLTLTGSTLRAQPIARKAEIAAALGEKVWPLLEAGEISPVMDSEFKLPQAAEAHRRMESSEHVGKIVLLA